jgi:hypothetical protein
MKNTRLRTRIANFFSDRIRRAESANLNIPIGLKMETNPFYTPHEIERAVKMCLSIGLTVNAVDGLYYPIPGKEGVPYNINQITDYSDNSIKNLKGNFYGESFARPYPNETSANGNLTLDGTIQGLIVASRYAVFVMIENTSTVNTVKFGFDGSSDASYFTLQKSERLCLYWCHAVIYVKGTIGDKVVFMCCKPLGS